MIKKTTLVERYKKVWLEKTGSQLDTKIAVHNITSHSIRWSNSSYSKNFIEKKASNMIFGGRFKKNCTILYYSQVGKIYLFESYNMHKKSLEYEVFKELALI